ncbi:MAG: mechanosensitive ion channel [Deltaproteobacteria bacterium]|nr:mechanosensitive ion channel [Deltaproteobacteria bacterium]
MQKVKEKKEKVDFVALLDLFQGLSFQLKNLQAELARAETPSLQLPSPGSPPYNLVAFAEMVSFQQKAAQQLGLYEEGLALGEARIAVLKDELPPLLPLYAQVKSEAASRIEAYEKLAYILSLQHEYAILQLKRPKLNKALTDIRVVVKEAAILVEQVFGQLQIDKKDIAELKKKLDLLNENHAGNLARLNAEYLDLNKQSVVVESKLDKAVTAMSSKAKEDTAAGAFESEKERLALVMEAIGFRQKSIIQEKMNLDLAIKGVMFRQEWLTAYVEMSKGKKPSDFVETWRKNGEELIAKKEALMRDLSLATQERSDLTRRLVAITNKVGASTDVDLQTVFAKQAEKTTENLDVYILGIDDNVHDLAQLHEEVELVLRLLLNRMDSGERFLTWGLVYLTSKWEQIRIVLFYPLITIGETAITLISICKVLVLLLIGVRLLKVIRRKTANLLAERTAMTPGAVNSMTTLVYYAALVIGILILLSTIGFNVSQLGIIFGALSVGLGFGLQTIANNFISGIILLTEQTIQVGDYVELQAGTTGEVRKISIRATIVRTFDGEDVIVPNSELVSSRVNTWSYEDNWRRLKVPFGVSYDSDPAEVVRLAEEAAREVRVTKEDTAHPLRILFEGFGNNSLDFSIRPWCWMNELNAQTGMISDYYFVLFKKLKEAGIGIPFPQTDLHLKSISPEVLAILQQIALAPGQPKAGGTGNNGAAQNVV